MKASSVMMTLAFSLVLGTLTGCGTEEVKSVDWWKDHPKEATEKYVSCKDSGEDTKNCQNVKTASRFIDYPPMREIKKKEADKIMGRE
jgi:hypothetical protein